MKFFLAALVGIVILTKVEAQGKQFVTLHVALYTINSIVTIGFSETEISARPGEMIEVVVRIFDGDLQPNETAVVDCISRDGTATGITL